MDQVNRTVVSTSDVPCPEGGNVTSNSTDYPESWYGQTSCDTSVSNGLCNSSKSVRLNNAQMSSTNQWNKTAAHEFGHVAGLGHRSTNNSCMTSGASPPISTTFDTHDVDAVNDTY